MSALTSYQVSLTSPTSLRCVSPCRMMRRNKEENELDGVLNMDGWRRREVGAEKVWDVDERAILDAQQVACWTGQNNRLTVFIEHAMFLEQV